MNVGAMSARILWLRGPLGHPRGRLFAAAFVSVVVTLGLFGLMQSLIATARGRLDEAVKGPVVEFVRLKREETLETKDRKPEKPPPAEKPPQAPSSERQAHGPSSGAIHIGNIAPDVSLDRGLALAVSEGDYLPIVKVAPMYPLRAQQRGIQGWVLLEFTVTKAGTVRDARVVEAKPSGIFDNAAIQAALKFKYKPRVIDGQPIEVPGVRHRIVFELER